MRRDDHARAPRRPAGGALGVDAVLATRYEHRDGAFTGGIDGGFVWGTGKLDGVRAYCAAEGFELASCTAVSDSIFDLPLLRAAGERLVVNPDPRLAVVARLLRWPVAQWRAAGPVPRALDVEPARELDAIATATTAVAVAPGAPRAARRRGGRSRLALRGRDA